MEEELKGLTIKKAHEKLESKELSCRELTQALFDFIDTHDQELSCYLSLDPEGALERASRIDKKIAGGEHPGILEGIPVAIKDNMLVGGQRCTAGSKILEHYVAPYDATVVRKLKEAGAVILGKTNLDEFAMGSSTENSAYGPTKNPRDLARVPGGSSGGSAAAVAAGECIYALGSDTGGSIRQPAAFCGIVGLKPTYGAVSRYGLIAMASSLDQIGPLTRTVEDAEIVFGAISGKDLLDSTSVVLNPKSDRSTGLRSPRAKSRGEYRNSKQIQNSKLEIQNMRIGVPKEYFVEGIDPGVERAVRRAIVNLEKEGAEIQEISLPHTKYALACYYLIMPSEVSANLARYDGIKYGYSHGASGDELLEGYLKTRREGFGAEVRRRIILGTYVLSAGYYDAYYLKAQRVRSLIKKDFQTAFAGVDVIITPTTPTPAFKFGEKTDDPLSMYLSDIYTVSINLAGVPALSLPAHDVEGLPVGIQFIGKWFDEAMLFRVGRAYENLNNYA